MTSQKVECFNEQNYRTHYKWHSYRKVLTSQLGQMEEDGLVERTVYPEVPPRVEYTLTELGYSLKPILDAMWKWGENYKEQCK